MSSSVQSSPGPGPCPLEQKQSAMTPSNHTGYCQHKAPSPKTTSLSSTLAYRRIWKESATFLSLKKKGCLYLGTLKDYDFPTTQNEAKFSELKGVMAKGRILLQDDVPALEIFVSNGLKSHQEGASGDQLEPTLNQILHVFRGCKKKEVQDYLLDAFSFTITMAKLGRGNISSRETIASVNFHVIDDRVYIGYLTVSNGQNGSPKNLLVSAERQSWQGYGLGTCLLNLLLGVCGTMSPPVVKAGLHLNCSDTKDTTTIQHLTRFYHRFGLEPTRGVSSLNFQKDLFEDAFCKHFAPFSKDGHNYILMLGPGIYNVNSTPTAADTSAQVLTTGSGTAHSQTSPCGVIVSPPYQSPCLSPLSPQPVHNQYTTPQATVNRVIHPERKKKSAPTKKKRKAIKKKKSRSQGKSIKGTEFKLNKTPTLPFNIT